MYTSIVVPLDGSAFGKRALPIALAMARRSDAALHLVHVHQATSNAAGGPKHDTRLDDEERSQMQAELTAVAEQLSRETSLRIEAEFLEGPIVPTLEGYLADHDHDLVVMMTHGRAGLGRGWLGSVADGLVRHAPVPLLLVPPGAEWPSDLVEPLFCHVLVPLDGSAMADDVLDHAVSLATPGVTVYTLLTVVVSLPLRGYPPPNSDGCTTDRPEVEDQRDAAQAHLMSMAEELRESGALVDTRVVMNPRAAQGILDAAGEEQVDAIALSTHGRGTGSRLLLGSVADSVVRGATVPVLIYRPSRVGAASADEEIGGGAAVTGATGA